MSDRQLGAYEAFARILGVIWDSENDFEGTMPTGLQSNDEPILFMANRNNCRTLVVPIDSEYGFTQTTYQHVSLTEARRGDKRCMLLSSSDGALKQVFASLVDDVLKRLREQGAPPPPEVTQSVLREWLELLRPGRQASRAEALGLVGELHVLILLAEINPHLALDRWTGPLGAVHDFTSPQGAIEVKATERSGNGIAVSSLNQLDPPESGPLTLVRLTFEEAHQGLGVEELVNEAVRLGCNQGQLIERIARMGHLVGNDQAPFQFKLQDRRQWNVTAEFPGLRSADIPASRAAAITHVQYGLDLTGAPGLLDDDLWYERLAGMMSA